MCTARLPQLWKREKRNFFKKKTKEQLVIITTGCISKTRMFSCESANIASVFISLVCTGFFICVFSSIPIQVKVNNEVATGTGPNKKVAKRNAAEAMLLQLGYKASTVPQNPAEVKTPSPACIFHICFIYKPPTLLHNCLFILLPDW